MIRKLRTIPVVLFALMFGSGQTAFSPGEPKDDRADLAKLAPHSNQATELGTYGDAAFARAPRHREELSARGVPCMGISFSEPDRSCERPADVFFRRNYVFTPSHVSAPQVFGQAPQRPEPLYPPVTEFFWNLLH